jgi:chemosensory pili system protein ChpA (sensor histidine kinase/response regulator)
MDVVQSEAQALGGRVDLYSERGKGTRFTIRLPLTWLSRRWCCWPQAARPTPAGHSGRAGAANEGSRARRSTQQGMRYLPTLLGDAAQPPVQRSAPVLMLKNGNEQLALQVDECWATARW